jgi:phosphoenolpyruvate---glycerone phosphotransferase subunit DhaL
MSEIATTLPALIGAAQQTIAEHAEEIAQLDQAIGDGDHVSNLQRGLAALAQQADAFSGLTWAAALQKVGMTVMSSVGGASGSLYGTLFVAMSKQIQQQAMSRAVLAAAFGQGVESVKLRGKADQGEKTMLDVLIPVAQLLARPESQGYPLADLIAEVKQVAESGVEATRDMIATKGRASFIGERSKGHLDAGAKSSQLMISAIADVFSAG